MAVYVDDARIPWRRYRMCHMIADSSYELDEMAEALGLKAHWKQKPFEPDEHYDIVWSIRQHAVILGAIPITQRQLAEKIRKRRNVDTTVSGYSYASDPYRIDHGPGGASPDGPPCPSCGAPEGDDCGWPCVPSHDEYAALDAAAWERDEMNAAVEELSLVGFERLADGR